MLVPASGTEPGDNARARFDAATAVIAIVLRSKAATGAVESNAVCIEISRARRVGDAQALR